nr:flavodoxin-dependent (E)-4-hydroxy-3-methylbut-2-enyl-diphosphate synthase [Armatimonadota bacterium]
MIVTYPRRLTREVRVGSVIVGGSHPIVVQSMITENTRDVEASVRQVIQLYEAGCEIVRVTTPTLYDAEAIGEIRRELDRRGIPVPLVADVHHEGTAIAVEVARHVDKVRINPGLFVFRKRSGDIEYTEEENRLALETIEQQMLPVIEACQKRDIAMRIGVNHGSLSDRILVAYGDTPEGMVQSALEFVNICRKHNYHNLILSFKASRVQIMLAANR